MSTSKRRSSRACNIAPHHQTPSLKPPKPKPAVEDEWADEVDIAFDEIVTIETSLDRALDQVIPRKPVN